MSLLFPSANASANQVRLPCARVQVRGRRYRVPLSGLIPTYVVLARRSPPSPGPCSPLGHQADKFPFDSRTVPFFRVAILPTNGHHLTLEDDIEPNLLGEDIHVAPTRIVSLENSLNGTVFPQDEIVSRLVSQRRSGQVETDELTQPVAILLLRSGSRSSCTSRDSSCTAMELGTFSYFAPTCFRLSLDPELRSSSSLFLHYPESGTLPPKLARRLRRSLT